MEDKKKVYKLSVTQPERKTTGFI